MHYHSRRSSLNNISQIKSMQSSSTILNRSKYAYTQYDQSFASNLNPNIIDNKQNEFISNNPHKQFSYYSKNKELAYPSQSPLRRASDHYEINVRENSVRKGQEYSYIHTRQGSELYNSGVVTSRGQENPYKPTLRNSSGLKSFRGREPSQQFQNLPSRDAYDSNRISGKRQQRYSYINQKQTKIYRGAAQINEKQTPINEDQKMNKRHLAHTQRYNSKLKQEAYQKGQRMPQQEKAEPISAVITPQKSRISVNTNPYLQKSQMLRQRMEKLEKMTPRGSIFKKLDEEVKRQAQQEYSPRLSISKTSSTHNSQISSAVGISQTKIADYDNCDFRSKELCDYYDQQNRQKAPETFQRNSVGDIEQLSNKINNRLKAIINKHQK